MILPLHSIELEGGKALITLLEGEGLQVPNLARKDYICVHDTDISNTHYKGLLPHKENAKLLTAVTTIPAQCRMSSKEAGRQRTRLDV